MDFTYSYDPVGNVKTILDAQNSAQVQSFDYDELDRLKAGGTTLTGDGQFARETYTYTLSTGNLLMKAGLTYTYGDAAHAHAVTALSNGNQYGYDANGNMASRHVLENGVWKDYTLAYDGDNRLISVTGAASASFGYDGDGRRIWATTGVTTTVFIGNYYEWNVALSEGTSYYYAGSTRLAMRKGSGEAAYFITDHLGSTNKLVAPTGAPLLNERQLYKPWGENRLSTLLTLTRYTYTGQYAQTEVGLMYYQARWYDPTLGRFAQADSIIPEASQGVQAWDRFAGMNNNPVIYNDPTGHRTVRGRKDAKDLIVFPEDKWEDDDVPELSHQSYSNLRTTFYAAVLAIGRKLAKVINQQRQLLCKAGEGQEYCSNISSTTAFALVFGQIEVIPGSVDAAAQANGTSGVKVNHYRSSDGQTISSAPWIISHPGIAIHELGHVLNNIFGKNPGKELSKITGMSRTNGNYGTPADDFNNFGGGKYTSQFSLTDQLDMPNELFADMFVGWVNDSLVKDRARVMNQFMWGLVFNFVP